MALVLYEKKDKLAYITLNRPERLNAITPEMAEELACSWEDFRDDDSLWVAILSGAGKSFCAGRDVDTLSQRWSGRSSIIFGDRPIGPTGYKVWKPIVVALQGYVLGAGLGLALTCDLRVASEDVEIGLPEPRVGIPTVFTPVMSRYMPYSIACELALLGERMDARRAYAVGILNRVVPPGQQMATAIAIAERLCQNGPLAVRAMKESLLRSRDMDYQGALAFAEHIFVPVMQSEDAAEGRRAFREKRKPVWRCK